VSCSRNPLNDLVRHSGQPRITVRGSATRDVRAGLKPAPTRYLPAFAGMTVGCLLIFFCGPLNATRSLFHSVGAVKLIDKATLIELFHELSIDQVFRLQSRHGRILQLSKVTTMTYQYKRFRSPTQPTGFSTTLCRAGFDFYLDRLLAWRYSFAA
jgi:hypothetical protein